MSDMAQGGEGLLRRLTALFLATFTISATANSGYAIIAVMRDDFVNKRGWFTEDEMNDYIAIVQSSPGPMAVTSSTVIGYHIAGFAGSFAAVLGVILPPFLVMIAVTLTGLRNCYLCRTEIRIVYPAVSGIECVILYQESVIDRVIEHDFPVKHEIFQHQSRGIVNGIRHDHIIL